MKKFLSIVACFMLACTSLAFVGCGKKGTYIGTSMPENYKIVTSAAKKATNADYTTTYTYIRGKYNNHAVVYLREVTNGVIDGDDIGYDDFYLWIAKEESTTVYDIDRGKIDYNSNSKYWGDSSVSNYTLSNWWWYIDASAFYPDKDLISSSEDELVYWYYRGDKIFISNDEYQYTKRREQQLTDGSSIIWTNAFNAGNFTSEIPNIAEYYTQLDA